VGLALSFDALAAISDHSASLADAAAGGLAAPVEHCPGWNVADLVRHVAEVHWFWGTIVDERLKAPPEESRRPAAAADDELISSFRAGAERLVSILGAADPGDQVWTWAPAQQDVAFVIRHQVQEAVVHHFDAAKATGREFSVAPEVASDAVDEFLHFSVSSEADPADPPRPALAGSFSIQAIDTGATWLVQDGSSPGTVSVQPAPRGAPPGLAATASALLLFLYERLDVDTGPVDGQLLARFRGLCFTD
jgi:uncharacterized protein (TIGR03083 family)